MPLPDSGDRCVSLKCEVVRDGPVIGQPAVGQQQPFLGDCHLQPRNLTHLICSVMHTVRLTNIWMPTYVQIIRFLTSVHLFVGF